MSMIDPRTLTDDVLLATVARLARAERETTAELLAHLVALEERNLHLACGFSSLFLYCRRVLHCSENGAYDRQQAARAARRFPVILAMLAGGQLHLTAVRLLAPHLKGEDHLALLGGAVHKTGEDVRELLARWFPQVDVPASVRRLPARRGREGRTECSSATPASVPTPAPPTGTPDAPARPGPTAGQGSTNVPSPSVASDSPPPLASRHTAQASGTTAAATESLPAASAPLQSPRPAPVPRPAVEPLAPGRHLFKFTGDDETVALLREAQQLLSHSLPNGDVAAIMKRGLLMVVEEARRARHAATKRPHAIAPAASVEDNQDTATRHIDAAVQRVVWQRDGGQCAFVGATGWRCEERRFLEYHHLRPWSVGGPPSTENIALRCRAHNQYEAHVYFAPIRQARSDG